MVEIHKAFLQAITPYRGDLPRVAREAGVSYRTLQKIVSGEIDNPGINTMQPVIDWLAAHNEWPLIEAAA
jgi:DNA-binding phage protein